MNFLTIIFSIDRRLPIYVYPKETIEFMNSNYFCANLKIINNGNIKKIIKQNDSWCSCRLCGIFRNRRDIGKNYLCCCCSLRFARILDLHHQFDYYLQYQNLFAYGIIPKKSYRKRFVNF